MGIKIGLGVLCASLSMLPDADELAEGDFAIDLMYQCWELCR